MELLASSTGVVLFGLVLAQLAPEGAATDQERRFAYFIGSCSVCCFIVVPGYITACCVPERPRGAGVHDQGRRRKVLLTEAPGACCVHLEKNLELNGLQHRAEVAVLAGWPPRQRPNWSGHPVRREAGQGPAAPHLGWAHGEHAL